MVWPCWYCFMKPKGDLYTDQSTTDEGDRKAQISIAGTEAHFLLPSMKSHSWPRNVAEPIPEYLKANPGKVGDISLSCPTPNKRLPLISPVYHPLTQGRGDTNTPINQLYIKESDTCWTIFSE